MSFNKEKSAAPTTSDCHPEDDMMSETSSIISATSSSQLPLRIEKLTVKPASPEEEIGHTDLPKEEFLKSQNLYALYSKSLDLILGVQKKLSKKDKTAVTASFAKPIVPTNLPMLQ